jgi:signal transduction histidine kinase
MEQVLMNLVVNARDAMTDGGQIIIETDNTILSEAQAKDLGLPSGHYVQMAVSDTGQGMGEETLSQIFEPFFTTKDAGKGTGLGLSTVYGIITQSGGQLAVESELGVGSTFRVYLPQLTDEPPHSAANDEDTAQLDVAKPTRETE